MEWEGLEGSESLQDIQTNALGEAVFASTIQAGVLGSDVSDDLDEAEIDRSIKEINEAVAPLLAAQGAERPRRRPVPQARATIAR